MNYSQIYKKLVHLRLHPIRVFCFHHVCGEFDSNSMHKIDWMSVDEFKRTILDLRNHGMSFISLEKAYSMISNDYIRLNKYGVVTFDDGYYSIMGVLPWLIEEKIPCTLFVNPRYFEGDVYREFPTEKYMSFEDILSVLDVSKGLVSVGMHGWEHEDASLQSHEEFLISITRSLDMLSQLSGFVPFWAYAWGKHSIESDQMLIEHKLVPVLIDGMRNFNDNKQIHRELIH